MYPTARNSLRRWSEHYHTKIPIPIAVTLHNFLLHPPSISATLSASSSTEDLIKELQGTSKSTFARVQHDRNLIPPITLEIVVHDNQVVLTETCQSVHPSWEHLDEKIDLQGEWWLHYNDNKTSNNNNKTTTTNTGVYKTMKLRFRLPNGKLFLEVPIYPSQLQKLDSEETPDRLPPNACFVYFSDGSTRLPPSIFSLLLQEQMTKPPPIEDFSRFEDDVFSALDSVPESPQHKRNPSTSSSRRGRSDSLLDVEERQPSAILLQQPSAAGSLLDSASGAEPAGFVFEHSEQEVLQHDLNQEAISLEEQIEREAQQYQEELEQLQKEKELLAIMVQTAKDLESQTASLETEIVRQTQHVHRAKFAKNAQSIHLFRDLHQYVYPITLDSQKGFLIRNLRLPVDLRTTVVPDEELSAALGFCSHLIFLMSKYLSIGLRHKIFCNSSRSAIQQDGGNGEDGGSGAAAPTSSSVLSIAVVAATSNNSHNLFPLFAARNVDKDQLERGLMLLGENANCLLNTLDVDYTPQSHILKRLSLVYEHILETKHMT